MKPPTTLVITQTLNDAEEAVVLLGHKRADGRSVRWIAEYNVDYLGEHAALHQARRLATTIAEAKKLEIKDDTR